MCFSATASLVAGSALVAVGIATAAKAKKKEERLFASMPLLFGIQQLIDGVAWLSIGNPALTQLAAYGFAFFAYVLWPLYVPLAVARMEKNREHRLAMYGLFVLGLVAALYALTNMLSGPVSAHIVNRCIRYDLPLSYPLLLLWFYVMATCVSMIISTKRFISMFGWLVLLSSAIAGWFYVEVFASVWCFFAAVLSGLIYAHFSARRKRTK
jgi:hypothetical protein